MREDFFDAWLFVIVNLATILFEIVLQTINCKVVSTDNYSMLNQVVNLFNLFVTGIGIWGASIFFSEQWDNVFFAKG